MYSAFSIDNKTFRICLPCNDDSSERITLRIFQCSYVPCARTMGRTKENAAPEDWDLYES